MSSRLPKILPLLSILLISLGTAHSSETTTTTIASNRAAALTQRLKLEHQIASIASRAEGRVGVAGSIIETGETFGINGAGQHPMQSVYKLPIAMALLQQVDAGTIGLDEPVKLTPDDYVAAPQHSPIRDKYPDGTEMTIRELLDYMLKQSDGSAADALLHIGGGTSRVRAFLESIDTTGVMVLNTEKEIGTDAETQYKNYATPTGMLGLLKSAHAGDGLSSASRNHLLTTMANCQTGKNRLKGLLPEGTVVAHKTGGSRTIDGVTAATNDVGIITLPDGRHLAIAVFVSDSKAETETRERVIAEIARAAYDAATSNQQP